MEKDYRLINFHQPQIILELAEEYPDHVICNRGINLRKEAHDKIQQAYEKDPIAGDMERYFLQNGGQTDPDLIDFATRKLHYQRFFSNKTADRVVVIIRTVDGLATVTSQIANVYNDGSGNLRFDFAGDPEIFKCLGFSNHQWRIWGWELIAIAKIDINYPDSVQDDPDGTIFAEIFKKFSADKLFTGLSSKKTALALR